MVKLLSVKELMWDKNFYPRMQMDWLTAYKYADAMRAGAKFPPIVVIRRNGGYLLIDGWHRVEACKQNKKEYVQSEILKNLSDREIYVEAVKRNNGHGRILTQQERANIILRLQDLKFKQIEIADIIRIPADKIKKFVADRLSYVSTGEKVILKAPLKNLAGQEMKGGIEEEQKVFTVRSQVELLDGLIVLIKNGWLDLGDEAIAVRVKELSRILKNVR